MGVRQANRGLAVLRIVLGVWLLREAMAHMAWAVGPWAAPAWVNALSAALAEQALTHPALWARVLIQQILLPNVGLYAGITVVVQLVAGLSLTFGLLTVAGGVLALLLGLLQGALTYHTGQAVLGYYLLLCLLAAVLALTRAGRQWGLDALLAGMRSRAWLW